MFGRVLLSMAILAVSMSLLGSSRWNRSIIGSIIGSDRIVPTTVSQVQEKTIVSTKQMVLLNTSKQEGTFPIHERKNESFVVDVLHINYDDEDHPDVEHSEPSAASIQVTTKTKVAWLISFPNSGTTYTIHNTEHVSQRSTATNYQNELHNKGEIISLSSTDKDNDRGPWQRNTSLPLPRNVLTKTHCAGYSDKATLRNSIITPEMFLHGCALSIRRRADSRNSTYQGSLKGVYPHRDLVQSVVHLIRNPFDNIISRMHHGISVRQKLRGWSKEQILEILESPETVMAWCQGSDKAFWMGINITYQVLMSFNATTLSKVPCHSEFFRYVQWHDAALRMIEREQLPSLVLYYEDYETNHNQTVKSILDFLELSRETESLPFTTGNTYTDAFFSKETQFETMGFLKAIASKEFWQLLQRYFPSISNRSAF